MNAEELKALQAPLKACYRENLAAAAVTLRATGLLGTHAKGRTFS